MAHAAVYLHLLAYNRCKRPEKSNTVPEMANKVVA